MLESTGSTFPKSWQWAILLGTPLALGLGYMIYKNQAVIDNIEEDEDKSGKKSIKKVGLFSKTISIDDDTKEANGQTPTTKSEKSKKLTPFEKAVELKSEGNDKFKIGKFDEAITLYDEAIAICPKEKVTDLSQFYQNRAAAYEQLKKWSSVMEDCTSALKLNSKYIKALCRRARAYENLNQLELCLEDITATCILEGFQNSQSLILADRILKEIGLQHANEALINRTPIVPSKHFVSTYFRSFTQDPIHKVVVTSTSPKGFLLAIESYKNGRMEEVIPACTEEIDNELHEKENYIKEALILRGTFWLLMGQYDDALVDLNKVINDKTCDSKLRSNALIKRASLQMQTENKDAAFEDFAKAVEIDESNPDIYHNRGQVYLLVEQPQNSIIEFEKAYSLQPSNSLTYIHKLYSEYHLAVSEGNNTLLFKKIEDFSNAVKEYPDCTECYSLFAQVLSDQQQYSLADSYFEKAMKLEPQNASFYVHRGLLYLQWEGDIEKALEYLKKAIEIDEKCVLAYETLGTVEVQRGNLVNGIALFDSAIQLAKSKMELTHIFSLRDAAKAQLNVTERFGLDMQNVLAGGLGMA